MLHHHYPTKGSFLICCYMQEVKNKQAAPCKPTLLPVTKGERWFAFHQEELLHYTLGVNLPLLLWYILNLMPSVNILIFPLQWFEYIEQEINYKTLKRVICTNPFFLFLFSRAFSDQSVFLLYTFLGQDSCTAALGKCVLFHVGWKVKTLWFFSPIYRVNGFPFCFQQITCWENFE